MKITKRIANALRRGMMLRKFSYSDIARECDDISREAVRQWVANQSIPDKHVGTVENITGIKVK